MSDWDNKTFFSITNVVRGALRVGENEFITRKLCDFYEPFQRWVLDRFNNADMKLLCGWEVSPYGCWADKVFFLVVEAFPSNQHKPRHLLVCRWGKKEGESKILAHSAPPFAEARVELEMKDQLRYLVTDNIIRGSGEFASPSWQAKPARRGPVCPQASP